MLRFYNLFVCLATVCLTTLAVQAQQTSDKTPREHALDFIRNETQFHLGYLPTEQSHPKTRGLSQALQGDTAKGIRMLLSVDGDIPPVAKGVILSPEFAKLRNAVKTALDANKKVFSAGAAQPVGYRSCSTRLTAVIGARRLSGIPSSRPPVGT